MKKQKVENKMRTITQQTLDVSDTSSKQRFAKMLSEEIRRAWDEADHSYGFEETISSAYELLWSLYDGDEGSLGELYWEATHNDCYGVSEDVITAAFERFQSE